MDEGVVGGGVGGSRGGALSDQSQVTAALQHFVHLQLILNITAAHACVRARVQKFEYINSCVRLCILPRVFILFSWKHEQCFFRLARRLLSSRLKYSLTRRHPSSA